LRHAHYRSPDFARYRDDLLSDDEYQALCTRLAQQPQAGDLIHRSGGLRKVRWAARGKGKSGGVRVIYYWARSDDEIYLFTLYSKSEKEDLTAKEVKSLRKLLEELK
jgi:hypothetical protein